MSALPNFHKAHGPPQPYAPATKAALRRFRGMLPDELLDEWRDHGWCSYAKGLLWTVNPDDYKDVICEWLPDWCGRGKKPPIVFARSAFGDLLVSRNNDVGQMNVHYGRYIHELGEVDIFLECSVDKSYVSHALDGTLARKAIKKLGPIGHDEMFTFAPALALGGAATLKSVQKAKLLPQFSMLVQLYNSISIE